MNDEVAPNTKSTVKGGMLTPEEAVEAANGLIKQMGLVEWPLCRLLQNPNMIANAALLVRYEEEEGTPSASYSYIVPYGIENDRDEFGFPMVRVCILVDATGGSFEEVTTFEMPVTYLTKEAAIGVVAAALRLTAEKLGKVEANLMFQPCEISHLRAYPFWEVVVDGRTYYVDQKRRLYNELLPGPGGN